MHRPLALCLLLCAPVLQATAQDASEPTVFLTISGGLATGQRLWRVSQPLCVWITVIGGYQCEQGPSGTVNDTLTLSRRLSTGFTAGIGLAKYVDSHLGGQLDVWYAAEAIQDLCTPAGAFQPDSDQKNEQTCAHFTADNESLSLVGVAVSALVRPLPGGVISPYLRAGAGLIVPMGETLSASGDFFANGRSLTRQMVQDSSGQGPRPYGMLALGVQTGSGVTSRFQIEVGDAIVPVDHLAAAADAGGRAPRGRVWTHNLNARFGFAFVFGSRHERRY